MTLEQLLALVGRLDDTPGFDTPRERFRRFLREHVQDPGAARALIQQSQHVPGEQAARARLDLVVLLGRFLGFDAHFGAPAFAAGPAHRGYWRSHARVDVVIHVTSAGDEQSVVDDLRRSASALDASAVERGRRLAGLCVVAPLSRHLADVEAAVAIGSAGLPTSVMTLQGLLSLVDLVGAGRMTHADVARVFQSAMPIDFIVGLLERSAAPHGAEAPLGSVSEREGPSYWIATVTPDYGTTPEEFLDLVVARRHVFGITDKGPSLGTVRAGDSICFYLPRKGVVGHARVASLGDGDPGSGIRDARRFGQVLKLEALHLHLDRPIPPDPETELRLRRAPAGVGRHAQTLVEISQDGFAAMTPPSRNLETGAAVAADVTTSERLSR